jgi:hypothetical protein
MGAVGKNLLFQGVSCQSPTPTALARYSRDKMRTKIVLQTLRLSSSRLLDLKPGDLSHKKPLVNLLDFLTDETRKSGKPREYFERAMLSLENFNGLCEGEKSIYIDLVRKILNKAFIN